MRQVKSPGVSGGATISRLRDKSVAPTAGMAGFRRRVDIGFHILGSSSSGNSALLVTPEARVLIDAGFSGRRLETALRAAGESPERLDAVFFTHEHGDHARGLAALAKFPGIRFFANRATARALAGETASPVNWEFFENGSDFCFRDLCVHAFPVPHDAADPVGFRFTVHAGTLFETRLAWITDLGHVPLVVRRHAEEADILVLEANYDPAMLDDSGRPLSLKQRIRGRHGHLSNSDAAELLESLESSRLRRVFLGHLSRECNRPDLVRDAVARAAASRPHVRYTVVDPDALAPTGL